MSANQRAGPRAPAATASRSAAAIPADGYLFPSRRGRDQILMCATPSRQARDVLLEEAKAEAEKDKEMVDSVVARIAAEDDREVRQTSKTADPTTGVSRQPACAPSGRAPGPACASPFRPIARATLSRAPACLRDTAEEPVLRDEGDDVGPLVGAGGLGRHLAQRAQQHGL